MNESTRRKVNLNFDKNPSFHHKYNVIFSLPYIKNKKVLDIGCWTGQFEQVASKYTKQIIGIDPGVEAIKSAKKLVPKAKFFVGDALNLNFPNKSFDTVTIMDVIEHIPKGTELKCLREVKRVLKPSGHIIISTPNAHILSILLDPAYFLIGHRHYSFQTLNKLLTKSGFEVIKTEKIGGTVRMFTALVESVTKHLFKSKLTIPRFIEKLIKLEYNSKFAFAEINIVAKLNV